MCTIFNLLNKIFDSVVRTRSCTGAVIDFRFFAIAFPLAVLVVMSLFGVLAIAATDDMVQTRSKLIERLSALTQSERKGLLTAAFDELETQSASIARSTFDYDALLDEIGRVPADIITWHRNETQLVPYKGMLRGAFGVLMDRTGNSLDRSLLLAELLKRVGQEVRLVRGTMTAPAAEKLLASLESDAVVTSKPGTTSPTSSSAPAGIPADLWGMVSAMQQNAVVDFMRGIKNASNVQIGALNEVVASPKVQAERDSYLSALRDHWWLQLKNDDGKWDSIDPVSVVLNPSAIIPVTVYSNNEVPDEQYHTVTLSVQALATHDSAPQTLVSQKFLAANMARRRISVHIAPHAGGAIDRIDYNTEDSGQLRTALVDAISENRRWMPTIVVDERAITDSAIDERGIVYKPTGSHAEDLASNVSDSTENALGKMGGLLGGVIDSDSNEAEQEKEQPAVKIADFRIVYQIEGPGVRTSMRVRSMLSALGETYDTPVSFFGNIDVYGQAYRISPEYTLSRIVDQTLALKDYLIGADSTDIPPTGLAQSALELAASRFVLGSTAWIGQANIMAFESRLATDSNNQLSMKYVYDIVDNQVDAFTSDEISAFKARMRQGVIDSNVEHGLMEMIDLSKRGTSNISSAATDLGHEAKNWQRIDSIDDLSNMSFDPSIRAELDPLINSGQIFLLVNHRGKAAAFWRIGSGNGTTLAVSATGRGQVMSEYNIALGEVIRRAQVMATVCLALNVAILGHPENCITSVFVPVLVVGTFGPYADIISMISLLVLAAGIV